MESIRTRPRIKLTPTSTQAGLSVFAAIGIAAAWLILALYYDKLPNTIYTHFGATGAPDASGPKSSLIALPIVATVIYLMLTGLMRVPHVCNYPAPITEENAAKQYGNAVGLFYWIRADMVWLFTYIEWMSIQTALGRAHGMGVLLTPVVLLVTFVPLVYYLIHTFKDK